MVQRTEELVRDMVNAVVDCCTPERVVLFGSRARGDAKPDSDVDLLVIEREPFAEGRSRVAELARIRRALRSFPASKDVLLFSLADVERWRESPNHVLARGLREGTILYARP